MNCHASQDQLRDRWIKLLPLRHLLEPLDGIVVLLDGIAFLLTVLDLRKDLSFGVSDVRAQLRGSGEEVHHDASKELGPEAKVLHRVNAELNIAYDGAQPFLVAS